MGRRCAFSARKRSAAMDPADALPSVKPHTNDVKVVRSRRRSKGMPRRGAFVRGCEGLGGGGGISETMIAAGFVGVTVAILAVERVSGGAGGDCGERRLR